MSSEPFRPILLETLQRVLRPLSVLVRPVPVGLERAPHHGLVLFVGNHTICGGLAIRGRGLRLTTVGAHLGTADLPNEKEGR